MKEFQQLSLMIQSLVSSGSQSQPFNQVRSQFLRRFGNTRSSSRILSNPQLLTRIKGVLSPQQQFEMQTAFALTMALGRQSPVPKTLFERNRGLALAMLPRGWRALGWQTGQLYFS